MPISIPAIDMVEIGAGGGSLVHVDAMRQIRVGPQKVRGPKLVPTVTGAAATARRLSMWIWFWADWTPTILQAARLP